VSEDTVLESLMAAWIRDELEQLVCKDLRYAGGRVSKAAVPSYEIPFTGILDLATDDDLPELPPIRFQVYSPPSHGTSCRWEAPRYRRDVPLLGHRRTQ
jgi:hypothetical protein